MHFDVVALIICLFSYNYASSVYAALNESSVSRQFEDRTTIRSCVMVYFIPELCVT